MAKLGVIVDGGFIRANLYTPKDPDNPDEPYGYPDANTIYQKVISLIDRNFSDDELFRIYYYDCIPDPYNTHTNKSPVSNTLKSDCWAISRLRTKTRSSIH